MFLKPARVYKMVGLSEALKGTEKPKNPGHASLPGMKQETKIEAKEDFEFREHRPKKIVYGTKDIEV